MSRFSPAVRPIANDGFARAIEEALGGYQRGTDRRLAAEDRQRQIGRESEADRMQREDRDRAISRQRDADAIAGISDERPGGMPLDALVDPRAGGAAYRPPPGVEGTIPDDTGMPGVGSDVDPLADAIAQSSMPMRPPEPRSASNIPGGFDPVVGRFAKALEPVRLPSGKWYNPGVGFEREVAAVMSRGQAQQELETSARGTRMGERAQQLGALAGTPGYEDLNAGLVTAASDNDSLYNEIVSRPERDRREQLAHERARELVGLRSSGAGTGGRASLPTEGERKAAALFKAGKFGYDSLERVLAGDDPATEEVETTPGREVPGWWRQQVAKAGYGTGNVFSDPQMRQMRASANILSDAWLRYTSGAAVPETEVARFAQSFTPVAGDDPGTLRLKAQARQVIISALESGAGRALDTADDGAFNAVLQRMQRTDPEAAALMLRLRQSRGTQPSAEESVQRSGGLPNNPDDY